jgi:hypothetical protein
MSMARKIIMETVIALPVKVYRCDKGIYTTKCADVDLELPNGTTIRLVFPNAS